MIREVTRMAVLRRAVQTTVAASTGFYLCLYGLDQPVAALYSLFAAIALGPLSPFAGTGRQRAAVVLRALPFGLVLVAIGTALAASTWAAVAGMLVLGFLLGFAPVGGPRSAGVAPGLQLFYILACFPPYAPQTLPARLAGAALGALLLAAADAFLFPEAPAPSYRARLADALETAAEAVTSHVPGERLREQGARLRLSKVPQSDRPTGPGREDRALGQAGSATRRLLEGLTYLPPPADRAAPDSSACAALLARIAELCASAATALRSGGKAPSAAPLEAAAEHIQAERIRLTAPPRRPDIAVLRQQSAALDLATAAWVTVIALGIAERRAPRPPAAGDVFWYATLSAPELWARRIEANLTRRSVWFQNAVRVALGLAVARLVAGTLDLAHGFWVLLAVLTLGRTTVGATWGAVRQAVIGNLAGAVAAGALLLTLGQRSEVYAALLVPAMLLAFLLGPLLGIAYAQGLFTCLVALVFAQVSPVNWQLSAVRLLDVVTGSVIGLLCGLLAWPAGGHREIRRTMADLLRECGALLPPTADLLTDPAPPRSSLPTLPLLHRLRLAEAAYAQYRNEPRADQEHAPADWHAVLIVAHQVLMGTHRLQRFDLRMCECGLAEPVLVDLDDWLTGIDRQLERIAASVTARPG